ncbi:NAD(P)-dependent oxidoreductase [Desertibacillus haloalkaliphilus]|uniref:NAD(P)-dependent oxidoreductase n=1 Tax=Desertibacillus haloalkaliphilus TaxID=1328930 RepID=UPI001C27CCC0|nr:NAD(P)-dependent oxidoreductase [Desertibacillus haloalkaliphilus]MBU8906737.1 NAD(P)-dependent oxidoreductase [Desertibacillus haloalkaliphilus]
MKVGFIGLGTMGLPMVKNILAAGFDTYVVSRSRPPIDEAVAHGAKEAESPKELIEQVDIVLTCLPLPQTVVDVYEGDNGLVAGATEGKIVIDHSTVSPELNKQVSTSLAAKGASFLDAPVSGGPMGAKAGTLTIMCGGDHDTFTHAYEVLNVIGDYVVHVGQTGNGSVIKLINNMLVGVHTAALSEAYVMGEKAGVNPAVLYDIIKKSSGFSKSMDWSVDAILDRQFEQRFSVKLLHKDMNLALDLAKGLDIPVQVATLAEEMVSKAKKEHSDEDVSAVIRPLEEKTGVVVKRWKDE